MICLVCEEQQKNSRGLAAHIRHQHGLTAQIYYDHFFKSDGEGICICEKQTAFKSILQGYCEFCSYDCAEDTRRMHLSATKKGKPNLALRGYKQSPEHIKKRILCGEDHPMFGRTGPDCPNYGRPGLALEDNPNWRGGVSFEPYSAEWTNTLRETIRDRDSRRCVLCSKAGVDNGRALSVHHIDYDKQNNESENLVSLCIACHISTNFNREYWKSLLGTREGGNIVRPGGSPAMTNVMQRTRV